MLRHAIPNISLGCCHVPNRDRIEEIINSSLLMPLGQNANDDRVANTKAHVTINETGDLSIVIENLPDAITDVAGLEGSLRAGLVRETDVGQVSIAFSRLTKASIRVPPSADPA